ncbi:MAG: branched-chain amino acid aminotransferase [Micavibrio sp.]|nr:MAG: branched-chain amino acid aminotransferase [Micavibrio sp.]
MALIPFDDRDGYIWLDGKMVNWREAKVHILSHGLHYASSVFEGERIYDDQIFKSREHAKRLINSANILGMEIPFSVDEIEDAKREVLEANKLSNGYVRPVAWRGAEQMGISASGTKTHVAIAAWEWGSYYDAEKHEKGITLKTSPWHKPPPDCAPTQSKAGCLYAIGTMSKHAAEDAGYDDALMLDYRGYVAEASSANLFVIRDGVLQTPPPDCFLNGITRQTVIQMAKDLGIPFEEVHIKPEELQNVQEVFLTGTAAELTAVGNIEDLDFTVGPITRQLRDAYGALARTKNTESAIITGT